MSRLLLAWSRHARRGRSPRQSTTFFVLSLLLLFLLSEFDSRALKRWQRGSVMSFLYIEPYEVRHEVLAKVKDLTGTS